MIAKIRQNEKPILLFTHLPEGSHFLYHHLNVLMILLAIIVIIIIIIFIIPPPMACHVGLDEDGLGPSDVAAAVWAGMASWLLLNYDHEPNTGKDRERQFTRSNPLSRTVSTSSDLFELCVVERVELSFKESVLKSAGKYQQFQQKLSIEVFHFVARWGDECLVFWLQDPAIAFKSCLVRDCALNALATGSCCQSAMKICDLRKYSNSSIVVSQRWVFSYFLFMFFLFFQLISCVLSHTHTHAYTCIDFYSKSMCLKRM